MVSSILLREYLLLSSVLLNTIRISTSTATIEIQLLRYNVSNGLLNTKKCCDSTASINCPVNQCDPYFSICLQDFSHISGCPLGNVTTDFTLNSDHITFKDTVGSTINKFVFHVNEYKGFIAKINVHDEDIAEGESVDERLDYLQYVYSQSADINSSNTVYHDILLRGQVSTLDLRVGIYCDTDYYGTFCTNHCLSDANFYCSKTGERICRWASCDRTSTLLTRSTQTSTTGVSQSHTHVATTSTPKTTTTGTTTSQKILHILTSTSTRVTTKSGHGTSGTTQLGVQTASSVAHSVLITQSSGSTVQTTALQTNQDIHKVTSNVAVIAGTVSSVAMVSGLSALVFLVYRRYVDKPSILFGGIRQARGRDDMEYRPKCFVEGRRSKTQVTFRPPNLASTTTDMSVF